MAATSPVPFKGSLILQEHGRKMQAAREARSRQQQAAIFSRSFAAAQLNRLTSSWRATAERIDDEIRTDLDALRARSRALENNNDYARNYLDIVETNLIGEQAPRLVPLIDNAPGSPDLGARAAVAKGWAEWCGRGVCEVTGNYAFDDLCQAVSRGLARDGEVLVEFIRGPDAGNRFGFAVRLLDVARIATWKHRPPSAGENAICSGVEVNAQGRAVGYWFNDSAQEARRAVRVEASTLLHRFVIQRAEQKRGIPWMHASMLSMHYAGEFALSALMAAKHGADHLGFFVTPDGSPPPVGEPTADEAGSRIATSAPGTWDTLPDGVDVKTVDSKYPNEVFGPFLKTANQRMASGLPGASYPELCNDYEAVNFSSIRAAILSARDEWRKRQRWFASAILDPIFDEWLRLSLLSGALLLDNGSALPLAKLPKFKAHGWRFRGWAWVDPVKDMEAARAAYELGITSLSRIASDMGRDIEDVF
ncbi:MAG TPA: phage portal protein, partial [Anaerolineae bacterium]|nr:phage portal protein [Anaerolineae bacterium]